LALFAKGRGQGGFQGVLVATWQHALTKDTYQCSASAIGGAVGKDQVLVVHRVRRVQSTNPNHGSWVYNDVSSLDGVDLRTGKIRWSSDIGMSVDGPAFLFPDGQHVITHRSSNYRRPYRYDGVWRLADGARIWGGRMRNSNALPPHLRPLTKTRSNTNLRFFFPELDRYVDMPKRTSRHDIVCRSMSTGKVLWQLRHGVGNHSPVKSIKKLGRRFVGFQSDGFPALYPVGHTVLDVATGKVALQFTCGPPDRGADDRYRDGMKALGKNSAGPFSRRFDSQELRACPTTADGKYLVYETVTPAARTRSNAPYMKYGETVIREVASGRVVVQLGKLEPARNGDARFLRGDRHLLRRDQIWLLPDIGSGEAARLVAQEKGRVIVSNDGGTVVFFTDDQIKVYR
jgi:hypothetical protein